MVFQNNSCTFADSMKKPKTMYIYRNTLGGRSDLLKSPPPLTNVNIEYSSTDKATTPALLYSVYTRVGRGFLCICLAALPLFMGSCQQDETAIEDALQVNMIEYYAESRGLMETSADSVCNYYKKLAGFHNTSPECEFDKLYPPTVENQGNAFTKYGIVQIGSIIVKTEWDGETVIYF